MDMPNWHIPKHEVGDLFNTFPQFFAKRNAFDKSYFGNDHTWECEGEIFSTNGSNVISEKKVETKSDEKVEEKVEEKNSLKLPQIPGIDGIDAPLDDLKLPFTNTRGSAQPFLRADEALAMAANPPVSFNCIFLFIFSNSCMIMSEVSL